MKFGKALVRLACIIHGGECFLQRVLFILVEGPIWQACTNTGGVCCTRPLIEVTHEQTYEQTEKASFTQTGQHRAVPFAIYDVALLDAGDEECSCSASPDYEIDSFVDAEGLLEAEDPGEKDQMLLSALEQQRTGAFAVYQTFLVCRQHALQLFTDLYGEQDAQQALSPLLLGISNLTVTVGREITSEKSPHGTLQVSYTNATTVPEVIEAHTGYAVTTIPKRSSTE